MKKPMNVRRNLCKAIVLKYSGIGTEDARVIRCNNNLHLCNDFDETDGYLDGMQFPDPSNLDAGLWIFEGDRNHYDDDAVPGYTGTYRRPTANELTDFVYLLGDWGAFSQSDTN